MPAIKRQNKSKGAFRLEKLRYCPVLLRKASRVWNLLIVRSRNDLISVVHNHDFNDAPIYYVPAILYTFL